MKKIIFIFIFIAIIQQIFVCFQMKNADNLKPQDLYEITLIKNGVAR